jgi:thymidylate kinase|tara:strand:+ start:1733 stop:3175 length:1443 start_codon:yes stop_codon:yes gene_type:complete
MLKIFKIFFRALKAEDITFCNWKGHSGVKSHLEGKGDLDLFIPIDSKKNFEQIAERVGFRRVLSYQANYPYIEHYYGFDTTTLQFAHIHVYFKIVTGEHISKNYVLPLESYLTNNLDSDFILPSINESAKLNIFLIRYFLKIGSLFGLLQYFREQDKYSTEWSSFDLNYECDQILELDLTKEMFCEMRNVFESSSFLGKFLLSMRVKKRLKKFRRRSFFIHQLYNVRNLNLRILNKIFLKKQKLLVPGFVVAICGLDGSGKSSLVSALRESFSKNFSVKVLHLGRPSSNLLTFLINPFISIYSNSRRIKITKSKEESSVKSSKFSNIHAFRSLLLAYDRKKESKKAHDFGKKGYIVICDRYPGLQEGKMDSPRIPVSKDRGWFYQFCYKLEKDMYNSIQPADAIFHLFVPIEISIERNNKRDKFGKETEEELRQRFAQNKDATFLSENYNFIDATFPFNKVFLKVSESIWRFRPLKLIKK